MTDYLPENLVLSLDDIKAKEVSQYEDLFARHLDLTNHTGFFRQYKFDETGKRKWRFDFAWPQKKIAVEIDGGVYKKKGRHAQTGGIIKDCEKLNEANIQGWHVLRFTPDMVLSGIALQVTERALNLL
jgi:very-short-patch-repair endonuclease